MTATTKQARDDMLALVKAAWDPTGHPLLFAGFQGHDDPPKTATPWARVSVRHGPSGQGSLRGDIGKRRWTRTGILTVQVFCDLSEADDLGKRVLDALEGATTDHGVWFRNVRLNEVGPDGNWYQTNVVADFSYDEVK